MVHIIWFDFALETANEACKVYNVKVIDFHSSTLQRALNFDWLRIDTIVLWLEKVNGKLEVI